MIKSLSTGLGELVGYSSSFYIIKQKTGFYITYDVSGKQLHTFSMSVVGVYKKVKLLYILEEYVVYFTNTIKIIVKLLISNLFFVLLQKRYQN